jgi:hypothetical protein
MGLYFLTLKDMIEDTLFTTGMATDHTSKHTGRNSHSRTDFNFYLTDRMTVKVKNDWEMSPVV